MLWDSLTSSNESKVTGARSFLKFDIGNSFKHREYQNESYENMTLLQAGTVLNESAVGSTESIQNISAIIAFEYVPRYSIEIMIVLCVVLSCMIVATIIGNVFVISAIILERSLQGVSNYLILSLAVTDLMVAVLVMPISVIDQVSEFWYLGSDLCDMWISFDVLCCTASILHLVAISLDRYWAVSNIDYIRRRSAKQIIIMIIIVWVVSIVISIAPVLGWKDNGNNPDILGICQISQDPAYTVFSTVGAFYCPLILMVVLNFKIYKAARSRIRKKHISAWTKPPFHRPSITNAEGTTRHNSSGSEVSQDGFTVYNGSCINGNEEESQFNYNENDDSDVNHRFLTVPSNVYVLNKQLNPPKTSENNNHKRTDNRDKERMRKAKIEMKRERKAARVLGIITGAFVACWLPFFILALAGPFCTFCYFPLELKSVFLWLGYFNSLLNPIIYTTFNPSFRNAFNKLFFKKRRRRRQ
ncbi:hypothetical protein FSP39_020074 [Pinctada imbricata]|uniref:G-protein coupled receptors family 1 profile domain-containing protein n=2 Tax=Pinctada TaxID=50425 RepID=A0AA88YN41_PINIB|nr:5-HT1 receptor [Pinctada fucata]KAK3108976.1 hypothetical protein FSP39_020074 [Pinctada imbricata]